MSFRIPARKPQDQVILPDALRQIMKNAPRIDPKDLADALERGISDGEIPVEGIPDMILAEWRRGFVIGWTSGRTCISPNTTPVMLREWCLPTVSMKAVTAFFSDDAEAPVMQAELETFLQEQSDGVLAEAELKELAVKHFAPRRWKNRNIWRDAWASERVQKRKRGEKSGPRVMRG